MAAATLAAGAQTSSTTPDAQSPPHSKLSRALTHFDLGVSAIVPITKSVSGTSSTGTQAPQNVTQSASTSAGVLATLRGQKSPYVGIEFNYAYGRATESYSCCNYDPTTGAALNSPFKAQSKMNEYTAGYAVRPPHRILGSQPYLAVGAGTLEFSPTHYGGSNLPTQARMTYYYAVGGETPLNDRFGLRYGLRQLFYLAPDFGQNFLLIKQHTFTTEPQFGFYMHF